MSQSDDTFAARLRAARDAAGLTQRDLAEKAGMAVAVVANLEQGQRPDPRMSTLVKLADALGVTTDLLTGRESP